MVFQQHSVEYFNRVMLQLSSRTGIQMNFNNWVEYWIRYSTFHFRCQNLDNKNVLTYQIMFGMTTFNTILLLVPSFLIKKVSPKLIMSEYNVRVSVSLLRMSLDWIVPFITGVWFLVSTAACFALNILIEFNVIVISFILYMSCSTCSVIAMAVAVNLYPTNYRGMATSFTQLIGQIGVFTFSNLVGLLLAKSCPTIFYLNGALAISMSKLLWFL